MVTWLLMLMFSQDSYAIDILLFDNSSDTNIAYKNIETSTPLPPIFTLCASFKENMIEETSFFTLFGESGKPWMTLSAWALTDENIKFMFVFMLIPSLDTFHPL